MNGYQEQDEPVDWDAVSTLSPETPIGPKSYPRDRGPFYDAARTE
jgi:hypothetical protein